VRVAGERFVSAAAALFLVGAACQRDPPPAVVTTVEPDWAFNQEDTPVRILGSGLLPGIRASARGPDAGGVDDVFRVFLDGEEPEVAELFAVRLESTTELSGIVPEGVALGRYDLRVVTPYGQEVVWAEPFDVLDTRADALAIEVEKVSYEVYELATVIVRLLDPFGVPLAQDREVRVSLTSTSGGGIDAEFFDGSLEDQVALTDAVGVAGRLGPDGVALVRFVVRTADTLTVEARPTSEGDPVDPDDVPIQFRSGTAALVNIELPVEPYVALAGEPFDAVVTLLDAGGNPLPDVSAVVAFGDTCSSWAAIADIRGPTRIPWVPRRATGTTDCPAMRVRVTSGGLAGESPEFQVQPGPVAGFEVDVSPRVLTAGDILNTFITPVDEYGNETAWTGTLTTLQDSAGGVVDASCTATAPVYCAVRVARVGQGLVLAVADDGGLTGASSGYDVAPGLPDHLVVDPPAETWVAGEPEPVAVGVADAWDNPLPAALLDPSALTVDDDAGEAVCDIATVDPLRLNLSCALYTAVPQTSLVVSEPTIPTGATVPDLEVVNGALSELQVTAGALALRAGEPLSLVVQAWDAWGNPVVVRGTSAVELSDTLTSVSPRLATLDATGRAEVEAMLTRKGLTRIEARVGSVTGVTPLIDVDAAALDHLTVLVDQAWVWVGEPNSLTVNAVDAYENVVDDVFGDVTLTTASGVTGSTVARLVNGTGLGSLTWSQFAINDVITASGVGETGTSRTLSAVKRCASLGPTPTLRFGGQTSATVCAPTGGRLATVAASFAGSAPAPGTSLLVYAATIDGGLPVTGPSPTLQLPVAREGVLDVAALVVQTDGCGAETSASVYSGPDDGEPVGPMVLSSQQPSLTIGPGGGAARVFLLGATTCRGVPAAGGTVRLRADRGALSGTTTTGSGLTLTLDAIGSGAFFLDAGVARHGGTATITAGVASGTASGRAHLEFLGDLRAPYVWWQDPKGGSAPVDLLTLAFSEPMDPATVTPAAFSVVGTGAPGVAAVSLDPAGREVDVSLTGLTPAAVQLQLRVADTLTDLAGNRLAGTWGSSVAAYTGPFGISAVVAGIGSCAASTSRFHPDGDDGAGEQADAVTVTYSAAAQPAWWVASVLDGGGAFLRQEHLRPNGASDAWLWDGRGDDGAVLPPGSYTLEVVPEDSLGNAGAGCRRVVDLELWEAP
jgi:hypothetical protein